MAATLSGGVPLRLPCRARDALTSPSPTTASPPSPIRRGQGHKNYATPDRRLEDVASQPKQPMGSDLLGRAEEVTELSALLREFPVGFGFQSSRSALPPAQAWPRATR